MTNVTTERHIHSGYHRVLIDGVVDDSWLVVLINPSLGNGRNGHFRAKRYVVRRNGKDVYPRPLKLSDVCECVKRVLAGQKFC